ncbi:MAG: DUF3240 family protein [Pseudomonadota bacterium]
MNNCLTIVLPKFLEEDMVDQLLEHPEWVSGFTTTDVSGHGRAVSYHAAAEEVRGRTTRVQVQIVLDDVKAQALLAHLRQGFRSSEIAYWIVPVTEFGRFA